jgi:RHS repeat-associated protein
MPTDIAFTGQHGNLEVGLLFYRARFYSPALGRFVSADSIVPEPGKPQSLNRYSYSLSNPLKYTDPTGHDVDCGIGESECRQRVRIEKLLSDIFDPIFGGGDFLRSLPPIPASSELNWYDLFGDATAAVGTYSELFNVPPEFVAATLNYENHRGSGPGGAFNRGVKRTINPVLQLVDPGHDRGLGYSIGVGNVKPATADTAENYFLTHYDPSSPEYQVMAALDQSSGSDKLILDKVNVLYVAANIRIAIDEIYYHGYTGAISQEGAAIILSYHNDPRSLIAGPSAPGIEGVDLLIRASRGEVPLLFFPGR